MAKTRPGWLTHIFTTVMLAILLSFTPTNAHSNVERLMRIAPNGTTIMPAGYPRGFFPRTAPGFFDKANSFLIPPNGPTKVLAPDLKLAHDWQRTANYTAPYNPLTAGPGDMIVLQYQENGHVSLPGNALNKTLNGGTVYIYGTADLSPDANLLDIHYQWNANGTGGDGKGRLLATRNYDDGQCHENNDKPIATQRAATYNKTIEQPMGTALWCQNDIVLPSDLAVGKPYTLIWVWDWPSMLEANVHYPPSSYNASTPGTNPSGIYIPELYTTIMDINIVDPCDDALGEVKAPTCNKGGVSRNTFKVTETDLNVAAIQEQLKNMFLVDVSANMVGAVSSPANGAPGLATLSAGSSSQCEATQTGTTGSSARATTTTTTASVPVTATALSTADRSDRPGRVSTTTVYESEIVTTVTVYPSATSVQPAKATVSTIQSTTTLTTFSTTLTQTVTGSPRLSASSSATTTPGLKSTTAAAAAASSSPTSGTGSATGTAAADAPKVTRFHKSNKARTHNKGRRAVGQWGFGHQDD